MIERPNADALLAGPLGIWLDVHSRLRTDTAAKAQRRFLWGVGLAAFVAFGVIFETGNIAAALQIGVVIGALGYGWSEWTKRPVVVQIKGGINGAIAEALGVRYSTAVTDPRLFDTARAWAMLPGFDESTCEDQWWGDVGGHPFCLHELKLTEQRGGGKSRRTVTTFSGCLISIGFARRFSGATLIQRKGRGGGLVKGLLGGLLGGDSNSITVNERRLGRIDLVDPRFDELFDVWASDPVEGHYLINPAYVERLMAVEQAFVGEKIRALFNGGDMLIVLETGNKFESGSLDADDDRRLVEQSISHFATLAELAMQLNERAR